MKIFVFVTLFVLCVVAHTPDSTSEESSSSEEIIYDNPPVNNKTTIEPSSESSSSSSSEEVIHTRNYEPEVRATDDDESSSSLSSSSEEVINSRRKQIKHVKKKSQYKRPDHNTRWAKYKIQYKLNFKNDRQEKKCKVRFIKSRLKVWKHKDTNKNSTVMIDLNKFAIISKKEFKRRLGFKAPAVESVRSFFTNDILRTSVPDSFDARTIPGAVTLVREQGDCGSCWAFATVAALETCFYLKYKKPYKFSEQHLIDCDGFNGGCEGGQVDTALNYIRRYEGINALKLYPYEDGRKRCRAEPSFNRPVFIKDIMGFRKPQEKGQSAEDIENQMKVAIATYGAVAVAIDAENMMFYSGGIYSGPCTNGVNHAVTIIGYDTDPETGMDYWIIKNSWGPDWGEAGFLRLKRGCNTCGVAQFVYVPIIADNIDLTNVPTDEKIGTY